jgi:hypothetical protein
MIRYRTDGIYPNNHTDGILLHSLKANRISDTAKGLAKSMTYHFAGFVKDSAGNWSLPSKSANVNLFLQNLTPPIIPGSFANGQDSLSIKEDTITKWVPAHLGLEPNAVKTYSLLSAPKWVSIQDSTLVFRPSSRDVGKFKISLVVSMGNPVDTLDMTANVINTNDPPIAFPPANWKSPTVWKEDIVDTFTVVVVDMDVSDSIGLFSQLLYYLCHGAGYWNYFQPYFQIYCKTNPKRYRLTTPKTAF